MVEPIFDKLSRDFDELYSGTGRPSIPPEQLLKGLLIQVLFTVRSERQLCEQLQYNLLYRWFVGLGMSGAVWNPTTFTKNRERLLLGDIADKFFREVVIFAEKKKLISKEHFTVDGTIIQAWASLKSFQERSKLDDKGSDDSSTGSNFKGTKGTKKTNQTHASKTDPECGLFTKHLSGPAKLCYLGHAMTENRNGLVIDARLTSPSFHAEPQAAIEMVMGLQSSKRKTLGADKHYDQTYFCEMLKKLGVSPHVTQNIHSNKFNTGIDQRTIRHSGYKISQYVRRRIEKVFGWLKTIGHMQRPMMRGKAKMEFSWMLALSCYNLVRIRALCAK
jgi:transposase